jgi:hypothetical protein
VSERVHADPDLPPGGWYSELGDALLYLGVIDAIPCGVKVLKAAAATPAQDA